MDRMSNDVIYQVNWGTDSFSGSYGLRFVPGRWYLTEGTPRRKSMRSRVEHRMQKESSRADKEMRRAKDVKLKLMPPDERLIYNLKRAKKKVALLLQKLKKYELPKLPPPKHDPELFTPEQLQAFKKIGFRNKNYVPVGVRGVFGGVVQNMHLHWKFHETVQVCCDNFPKEKIKEMATMLAKLSGGIVINIHNVKTIIMFRGRNYRQPKNLIPINTLTKRKALFKARFEQALQSQKLNIKKYEQELRKMGIEPADSALISSQQRIAATFFSAIDKKEGTPYVSHGDEHANRDSQRTVELFDASIDSDQEELEKFIAEIEGAADKEWAEEEAAEKEDFGKIRNRNREEFGGRFRKPELCTGGDESRGWKGSNRKRIVSDSDDEDDLPEDTNGWESEGEDRRHEIGGEANDDRSTKYRERVERDEPLRTMRPSHMDYSNRGRDSARKKHFDEERDSDGLLSDLEDVLSDSASDAENGLKTRNCGINDDWSADEKEDHLLMRRDRSTILKQPDNFDSDEDDNKAVDSWPSLSGDNGRKPHKAARCSSGLKRNSKTDKSRKIKSSESETDEPHSNLETEIWEFDDQEDFSARALRAADDDYQDAGGVANYLLEDESNGFSKKRTNKLEDEMWDSD